MPMRKTLLNASFEESQKISPNLFKNKLMSYDVGLSDSPQFSKRLFLFIPWIMLSTMMYGFGGFLPEYVATTPSANEDIHFMSRDIYLGIGYFVFVKFVLVAIIIMVVIITVLNLFPKKNYMVQRIFGVLSGLNLLTMFYFSMMPLLLGIALGAVGWLGFTLIILYGVIFLLTTLRNRGEEIKQELYKDYKVESNWLDSVWQVLRKIWAIPAIMIILNLLTFRIGMWGKFSLWSFPWLFAGLLYFGLVTAFSYGTLRMFVSSFYFAKYAEQYRILWKVSDEQWYGKRKARKIAKKKKKKKQEKKEDKK